MSYNGLTVGLNKLEDLDQRLRVFRIIISGVFIMSFFVRVQPRGKMLFSPINAFRKIM